MTDALSTSERLRQTQHELAHAQFELSTATARIAALTDDLKQARLRIDGYHADYQEWDGEKQEMVDASLALKAELASATAELEQLRAARQWIVARDGGRDCVRCDQEIRRGEAYELMPGVDELQHIHCPTPEPEEPSDVDTDPRP